jgi:uncharacterized membrane protein
MDKKLYWASIALAGLGVAVSIYMTVYKLTSNNAMCLGSGDCATVNASPYAEVYGIPVAVVGVGGYLAILAVLLLEMRGGRLFDEQGPLAVFGLSVGGFGFTLYLIYIEAYVLGAWCPFCVTSQITMTILFVLSIVRLVRQPTH